MDYLFVLVLMIVHSSHGYSPESKPQDKFKLSAEPGYFREEGKSNHNISPRVREIKEELTHEHKNGDSNFDLYKPHTSFEPYGPSDEDSKYIPHSKIFTKFIISQKNPSVDNKSNAKETEDLDKGEYKEESDEIPRYGFVSDKTKDELSKDYRSENAEGVVENIHRNNKMYKKSFDHKSNYEPHSTNDYKRPDYQHTLHDAYQDQNKEYRHPRHPEQKKSHTHSQSDYKEEHRHSYPEYEEHSKPHHKIENIYYNNPNGKNKQVYPPYVDSSGIHENHHHPQYNRKREYNYYQNYKGMHGNHGDSQVKEEFDEHLEHKNVHPKYHDAKYEEAHDKHYNLGYNDDKGKKHLPYQHWSDKNAQSFPEQNSDKLAEKIGNSKSSTVRHPGWHENPSHNLHINNFIKEHKLNFPKPLHQVNLDKVHHKKHIDDTKNNHYSSNHSPYKNRHRTGHDFKSFSNYKPKFNVGGHSYGRMYKPKVNLYQQLRKDLDLKMRLLKEHEEKLAELQRGHLQKYRALFEPQHSKKYLNYELPERIIPDVSHKYRSHSEISSEENGQEISPNKPQSEYHTNVLEFNEHKPHQYIPHHHDTHHATYKDRTEESKHYMNDSHPDKKE